VYFAGLPCADIAKRGRAFAPLVLNYSVYSVHLVYVNVAQC